MWLPVQDKDWNLFRKLVNKIWKVKDAVIHKHVCGGKNQLHRMEGAWMLSQKEQQQQQKTNKQNTSLNNVFQAEVTLDEKNSRNNEKQTIHITKQCVPG